MFNGVSQAAREIARETSVHPARRHRHQPGDGRDGRDPDAASSRVSTVTSYACVDIAGVPSAGTCQPGDWVRVTTRRPSTPVMPFLTALGPIVLSSASSAEIQ